MSITYVNIHGQPVTITPGKAAKKSSASAPRDAAHKGFAAVGFSPEHLAKAKAEYERLATEQSKPWSEDAYMAHAKPGKIRAAAFEIPSAAELACSLAEKQGWKQCRVVPLLRKGK